MHLRSIRQSFLDTRYVNACKGPRLSLPGFAFITTLLLLGITTLNAVLLGHLTLVRWSVRKYYLRRFGSPFQALLSLLGSVAEIAGNSLSFFLSDRLCYWDCQYAELKVYIFQCPLQVRGRGALSVNKSPGIGPS